MMYRIRNEQGLYSTGGSAPSFTTVGKIWPKRGNLNSHLGMFKRRGIPEDWVIEECEFVVNNEYKASTWQKLP
jgi:hypothetical protein